MVGIVLLGTLLVARAGEVLWQQRSGKSLVTDAALRFWLAATLLAGGASLVNPYGIGLFVNSLTFGSNPNLQDMTEWSAMQWGQLQTYYMLFCTVTFLAVAIVNRQRLRVTDVLLMVVFSIFLLRYVRMGFWYVSVFAYVVTPLVAGMFARESDSAHPPNAVTMERRQKMSQVMGLVCILVVAAAFALSPLGRSILGRPPRPPQQLVASGTPLLATEFLLDHPPEGQVYNPQWWGDWLALAGPRGLKVFLTTNTVHVAPSELWKDYIAVAQLAPGWQQTLEKYDVTTIISDKQRMSGLSAELRKLPGYQIVYEDNVAIIATKEELIPPPEDQNADSGDSSAS